MIAAHANAGRSGIVVRTPQTWTGFAVGVFVGGLAVGWMASHPAPSARHAPGGLTAAEEGTLRAALAALAGATAPAIKRR